MLPYAQHSILENFKNDGQLKWRVKTAAAIRLN